jgi:lysophospholipase L1-like esterase
VDADGGAGAAAIVGTSSDARTRRKQRWIGLAIGVVWLGGSGLVAAAQPGSDRRLAAIGGATAGILVILVVSRLTADPARRYVRSVVGAIVASSVASEWLLWRLDASSSGFEIDGMVKRIVLPLLVVLVAPLAAKELWTRRTRALNAARPMDWIVAAYGSVVLVPALAVGLMHHNRLLFIAQDLGLIVFFCFMYLVGRAVTAEAARASAAELVEVLLLLATARWMLVSWDVFPIYSYFEAAAAGALAVLLLQRRSTRLLPVGLAIALLALDAEQVRAGTNSSTAVELAGALGILAYLALRARRVLPQWLLVAGALVAIAGFVGLTSDGSALRGQYYGPDASNAGRTYEAHAVRAAVGHSPSALLGRGLGGTIDETSAPPAFRTTLVYGGRDLAHVQEIHLLVYSFLLKAGYLGLAWLAAFLAGLAILVFRGLERAARQRDPRLVVYVALPFLAVAQASAASSRLQSNPLTGLALGILVTWLAARRPSPGPIRVHRKEILARRKEVLAGAACTLAGCLAVAYLSIHRTPTYQPAALPNQPVSLWIGDSYTLGAGATSSATGEALATSAALGWQTDLDAEGATGFVASGHAANPSWKPIPDRLRHDAVTFSPPPPSVVVLDAGRNDRGVPRGELHRAVLKSFRLLAKGFPSSAIVVIAPFVMNSKPTSYLGLRQLLRREAKRRGWAFVDPIAERWINRASAKLMVSDHIHPNQQGYDYIVAHLAPAIERALRAAHEHVRLHCTKATPCRMRATRAR